MRFLRVIAGFLAFLLLATSGWCCVLGCGMGLAWDGGSPGRVLLAGWVMLALGVACLRFSLQSEK